MTYLDKSLISFSQDEIYLVEIIMGILKNSSDSCLSLNEFIQITGIRKSLLSIYLSKLAEHGFVIKKRKYVDGRRLMIYCLNI